MKIKLYALGGAGINIGTHFEKHRGNIESAFAPIDTVYVDTSKSNLSNGVSEEHVYRLNSVDGSGKKRITNYDAIVEAAPEILHQFKPSDINLVVHSASGGSGSVLGPTLVSMLLERGERVIVLTIGSRSSQIELDNTIKTLKSYDSISQRRGRPVVMFYRENNKQGRGQVDAEMKAVIPLIAAICSGNNKELDSEDIGNFLNYPNVTTFSPGLTLLDFFSGKVLVGKDQHLISAVTLINDSCIPDIEGHLCPYQATGFLADDAIRSLAVDLPLHACAIGGVFNNVVKEMETTLAEFTQSYSVIRSKNIANVNDSDDLGLVI